MGPIPSHIETRIYQIRGHRVMIDSDLAELYGVPTKSLNLAVKRNLERFPDDFMFQLNKEEYDVLRHQSEISKDPRGGRRYAEMVLIAVGINRVLVPLFQPLIDGYSEVIRNFVPVYRTKFFYNACVFHETNKITIIGDWQAKCKGVPSSIRPTDFERLWDNCSEAIRLYWIDPKNTVEPESKMPKEIKRAKYGTEGEILHLRLENIR